MCLTGSDSVFHAIPSSEIDQSQCGIGIGIRIWCTQFVTCCHRVVNIANQAAKNSTVTGWNGRIDTQGSYDTYWRFETWFQAVKRVSCGRNEWVDGFIVFEKAHNSANTQGRSRFFAHIFRAKEVNEFTGFQLSHNAEMSMFTRTCYTDDRFSLEGYIQTVFTEYFTYDDTGLQFIISCLQWIIGELPVDFQLFQYGIHMTVVIQLSLNATNFFVTHFCRHAILIKAFNSLFKSSANRTMSPLPVLFLQFLRYGQITFSYGFRWCFNPEFKFSSRCEHDISNVFRFYMRHTR